MKNLIQKLFKSFGYKLVKNKSFETMNFDIKNIFNYFERWVTIFEIDKQRFNERHDELLTSDYKSERVSMLNIDKVKEATNFKDKKIIEFGPLEGGNSILLESLGIKSNVAIEGHRENYIKCCVIKNLFKLDRTSFIFEDAMNVDKLKLGNFDCAFVAGLLYHLKEPHLFIEKLSGICNSIILSTHYSSEDQINHSIKLNDTFIKGYKYEESPGPNSGLDSYSFWPTKEGLLEILKINGFKKIDIVRDFNDDYHLEKQKSTYKMIYLIAHKI